MPTIAEQYPEQLAQLRKRRDEIAQACDGAEVKIDFIAVKGNSLVASYAVDTGRETRTVFAAVSLKKPRLWWWQRGDAA
jgi:hypothetical protein